MVRNTRELRYRRHLRVLGYDYARPGYYFVTICVSQRKALFVPRIDPTYGHRLIEPVAAKLALPCGPCDELSHIVEANLLALPQRFSNLAIDFYIIMPDHMHVIMTMVEKKMGVTLPKVIQAYKSITTREAKQALQLQDINLGKRLWQPNYFEHVIRHDAELNKIREYILANPYDIEPWST